MAPAVPPTVWCRPARPPRHQPSRRQAADPAARPLRLQAGGVSEKDFEELVLKLHEIEVRRGGAARARPS